MVAREPTTRSISVSRPCGQRRVGRTYTLAQGSGVEKICQNDTEGDASMEGQAMPYTVHVLPAPLCRSECLSHWEGRFTAQTIGASRAEWADAGTAPGRYDRLDSGAGQHPNGLVA